MQPTDFPTLPNHHHRTLVRLSTKAMRQAQVNNLVAVLDMEIAKAEEQITLWGPIVQSMTDSNYTGWRAEHARLKRERTQILAAHAKREFDELCRKQGKRGSR